jgi:hypothetical protein
LTFFDTLRKRALEDGVEEKGEGRRFGGGGDEALMMMSFIGSFRSNLEIRVYWGRR